MTAKHIFLILFSIYSFVGNSQSLVGVTGGYTKSFFRCNERNYDASATFSQVKNDYTFGIFYKERRQQQYNLVMDLNFLHRNTYASVHSASGHGGGWSSNTKWDIYSIGFKIAPEFSIGNRFHFYLNAGPYISNIFHLLAYGNGGSWQYSDNWMTITTSNWKVDGKSKDFLYGLELAISSQCGIEFPISKKIKLHAEANYILGLASSSGAKLYSAFIKCNTLFVSGGISISINNTCITTRVNNFFEKHPNKARSDYKEK